MTIAGAADHLKSTKKYNKSNAKRGNSNLRTKIKFPFRGIEPQKKDTKMCFGEMISMIISNKTITKSCPLPSEIQFDQEGPKMPPFDVIGSVVAFGVTWNPHELLHLEWDILRLQ